jgi:uncharacterized lipoprotein YmbA
MIVTICAQLVLGCTTTRPPPTDFVLGIQGGPAQPPNSGTVKVYVHKAEVPAYLARRNLASTEGDKVRYSSAGLWAAPLDETIALAVAANLSGAGISAVGFQPLQRPPAHTLNLIIRFTNFEGRQTGDVWWPVLGVLSRPPARRWQPILSPSVVRVGNWEATHAWLRS